MKANELPRLAARLAELAEYYDKRAPGTAALRVWLDALTECHLDDALAVLTDWPKTHRQMPLADEVLRLCRGRLSDRIEAEAERNRRTAGTIGEFVSNLERNALSEEAKQARKEIAAMLAKGRSLEAH
jgi:hypothetical protein